MAIDKNGDSDGRRSQTARITINIIRNNFCPTFVNLDTVVPLNIDESLTTVTLLQLADYVQDNDPTVSWVFLLFFYLYNIRLTLKCEARPEIFIFVST